MVMVTTQNIGLPQKWVQALNLTPRLGLDVIAEARPDMVYANALQDALELGVCAVHCIEGIPCAAILHDPDQDKAKVDNVHKTLWNQGIADFLFVVHDDVLAIHSLWAPPFERTETDGRPDPRLIESLSLINQSALIADLLPKVESGRLFNDHSEKLNHKTRVDARLISDLTAYRRSLTSAGAITLDQAHRALLQVMFLRYLWDRGIISDTHTRHYGGSDYTTLHGLLRGSLAGWQNLLSFLSKAFNGNMLLPDDNVWCLGKDHLAHFLEGVYDPATEQYRLFPLYDFKHIPVELISEVYDRFLESADEQKEHGAYYTPRRLAGLVVDQAWPSIQICLDKGITPHILDPTCGSGVFLVTAFQRIANRLKGTLKQSCWLALKEQVANLHGTDTNPTAIQIAAFSLALALLNEREPREIEAELIEGNTILPVLLGTSLREQDFFSLPEEYKYHSILGNPPWGQQKGESPSSGELWCEGKLFRRPPNREKAWPFLWKAPRHLNKDGRLTLVLPMTGCVLIKEADRSLRQLAEAMHFECLVDLSDLRNTLFPGAKIPACVLDATLKEMNDVTPYRYEHLCPKADFHATKAGRILLAPEDRHTVWLQHFLVSPGHVCKRLMWGSPVEERLRGYLDSLPRLDNLLLTTETARRRYGDSRPDWGVGLGFQKFKSEKDKRINVPKLLEMPYLESPESLVPFVQPHLNTPHHPQAVRRQHFPEAFDAPHIVMIPSTSGRTKYRLRAAYSEQSFSFNKSLVGVVVPDTRAGRETAKLLTAILNSTLAGWYIYYTTSVGADRERLSQYNIFMGLPFPEPSDLPNPELAQQERRKIIAVMDELLEMPNHRSPVLEQRLDDLVFAYYGVDAREVVVIREVLALIRPAMHPGLRNFPRLWDTVTSSEQTAYCKTLSSALSCKMQADTRVQAYVVDQTRELALVRVSRSPASHVAGQGEPAVSAIPKMSILEAQPDLRHRLIQELRHNVYLERAVFFFFGDDAYLLKPMQCRFWLTRAALRDADRFVDYLLLPDPVQDGPQQ